MLFHGAMAQWSIYPIHLFLPTVQTGENELIGQIRIGFGLSNTKKSAKVPRELAKKPVCQYSDTLRFVVYSHTKSTEIAMSTGSFPDAHYAGSTRPLHATHVPVSRGGEPAGDADIDQGLIRETRDQIRSLVDEITRLAQSNCSKKEFCQGFLTRTVGALASLGGAIWMKNPGAPRFALEYQINLSQTALASSDAAQIAHDRLLERIALAGQPELVAPRSGAADQHDNPTDHLLIIVPLSIEQEVIGLVEIFQRPGTGPTTQRGYLRFLVQMGELASDFLRNERLRRYAHQETMWDRMQAFVRAIHGGLDVRRTAFAIANEGRRVLDAERVSVAIQRGGRLDVHSISGLDSIERRADQVKRLGRLATTVAKAGQPIWYSGDDTHLPPQIEMQLHEYLDVSHARMLVVHPLHQTSALHDDEVSQQDQNDSRPVIGALIVEQFGDQRPATGLREQLLAVAAHCEVALSNSLGHSNMFLAPLWTWLGQTTAITMSRRLPRLFMACGALVLLFASLWLVPWSFTLSANGRLTPENRTEIYAEVQGILQELRVPEDPDAIVNAGDILAVLTNNQLLVDIRNLQGQLSQADEESKKLQRSLARQSELSALDRGIIDGDLAEAYQLKESLARQLQLKMEELELLNIRAPTTGNVINWQLRQNLLRRPVQRGQNLMTLVAPDTPWQIELEFPERRVAHLMKAVDSGREPLTVTFVLASHPGTEFSGKLVSIDNKMDVRGDEGNAVLLRVSVDSAQLPGDLLRSGTRVTAQVHAGTRSLGYVWFHEFFESVQSTWTFWF